MLHLQLNKILSLKKIDESKKDIFQENEWWVGFHNL